MSEKTEKPTEKKLRDGRKAGKVVKSVEITSAVQLAFLFLYFHFFIDSLIQRASALILLVVNAINKPFVYALAQISAASIAFLSRALLLLAGGLAITAVLGVMLQIGFVFASKAIGFKSERLNIAKNFKRLFSLNSAIELLKSSLKVIFLCLIFMTIFYTSARTFLALPYCGVSCALPVFYRLMREMWIGLMVFYVVLGALDYAFQRYKLLKEQRMSKEDIKQEHKDTEGDPQTKSRRRALQNEIQSGSLAQSVKQSVAVVRNPTHFAVCIGYHPTDMPVPRVLEKGRGDSASHIIKLAEYNLIPVVENISLARALFFEVERGDKIPESLFEPVAALLRIVLQIEYEH
ncbi:EscU/YscU/HrcU family type III secretion system export apparatus switch protein [Kosakonia sp. BYX6]|uniref:EscU/YscU/HrcU family type III secretion system export apparatus switch protein n=1 Tax=Kosakonia calanthes TaxID=3139408 RepID=A0ABZ3B615_9ENTR